MTRTRTSVIAIAALVVGIAVGSWSSTVARPANQFQPTATLGRPSDLITPIATLGRPSDLITPAVGIGDILATHEARIDALETQVARD